MSGDRERRALLERLQTELRDLRAGIAPPEPPPEALIALEAELVPMRAAAAQTALRLSALEAELDEAQAEFDRLSAAVLALHVKRLPGWDGWSSPSPDELARRPPPPPPARRDKTLGPTDVVIVLIALALLLMFFKR